MNRLEIFLQPGEVVFAQADTVLSTILGSCVAITLWHPFKRLGGMCHIMLPNSTSRKNIQGDGRYAQEAIQLLRNAIRKAGLNEYELEVKLFGGGSMLSSYSKAGALANDLSLRNIHEAKSLIENSRWNLVAEHTGGRGHRHIKFDIDSGEVLVRFTPLINCDSCSVDSDKYGINCRSMCA